MSPLVKLQILANDSYDAVACFLTEVRRSKISLLSSASTISKTFKANFTWDDVTRQMGYIWEETRSLFVLPVLKSLVFLCVVLSVMLFIEIMWMGFVILFVKLFKRKPEKVYKWEAIEEDLEDGNLSYPMVLVQLPMYNEKEVCQFSIEAACMISWPSDRIIIQVLDDSTDPASKELVEMECQKWAGKGINIKSEKRDNRNGFKAGALREGMKHSYVEQCDFIVIFDADFQPDPDFLSRTVPFLIHNPEIALVQTRWKFVNANACMMTRLQEMSLGYHFTVEQQVGSSTVAFFGFNGTAGVWRLSALNEAGGWNDQTTVEDMDLAVRASLRGWKFVFVNDLEVKSELPSTLNALRNQQFRWTCGPANLFRKMALEIIRNKKVSFWKKFYMIYCFFFVRKIVAHIVTFFFYCVVLPATVLVPEVEAPRWAVFYAPALITLFIAVGKPRSFYLLVFWVLFENVMSLHRIKAMFAGLLDTGGANEWVVTEKLGDPLLKTKLNHETPRKSRINIRERIHLLELSVGVYLLFCGCYDIAFGKNSYFVYLFFQALAFFVVGFGYVGTFAPTS